MEWLRVPIQHKVQPSAVLQAQDHALQVLYSAHSTIMSRTKVAEVA